MLFRSFQPLFARGYLRLHLRTHEPCTCISLTIYDLCTISIDSTINNIYLVPGIGHKTGTG